jgi:hypothetical protein
VIGVVTVVNVCNGKIDFVDGGFEGHSEMTRSDPLGQLNGFANVWDTGINNFRNSYVAIYCDIPCIDKIAYTNSTARRFTSSLTVM